MKVKLISVLETISKQSRLAVVNGKTYIVKDYASEVGLLKWYIIALSNLALRIYPFRLEPIERLKREVLFMRNASNCFQKPEILLVDYARSKLIREFVKGEVYGYNAPNSVHFEVGRNIGLCHENGWVLGDTKASNFVYHGSKVYVVDAEQAINEYSPECAAWDLLVLISTLFMESYVKALNVDMSTRVLETVMDGYTKGNKNSSEVLKVLNSGDFKVLSYLFIPFPLNYVFVKKIEGLQA